VNKELEQPTKDFKGRVQGGRVTEIGVNIFDDDCFALQPVYKLKKASMRRWLDQMGVLIERGDVQVYAENAFNQISGELRIQPLHYADVCMEVDTPEDLALAMSLFKAKTLV